MGAPPAPQRRGRGLIIAGISLLCVSVAGGTLGFTILGGNLATSINDFSDVAVDGSSDRLIPGEISFEVLEPLDGDDPEMSVGIAVDSDRAEPPSCELADADGDEIVTTVPRSGDELLDRTGQLSGFDVVALARLGPGSYTASCGADGAEPSASGSFAVGRVITIDDVSGMVGTVFGLLGVVAVAGLLFLVGLVLLIVGLVQRSRSNRTPGPPEGGQPWAPHGAAPPGAWPGQPPGAWPGQPPGAWPGQPPGGSWGPSQGPPGPGSAPPTVPGPPSAPPAPSPPSPPAEESEGSVGGWTIPPSKS